MAESGKRRERGAVLFEFALLALVFYMLLATLISFGRLFFSYQVVQDAARLGALELSRMPLPAEMTFEEALADPMVRQRVYDPDYLVVDLDNIPGGLDIQEYFDRAPVLNQALRPAMVFQIADGRRLLRYPGALIRDATKPSGYTVSIPWVESRDAEGVETIRWVEPVEEIRRDPAVSPFSMNAPGPQQGMVGLRINYPYQSAALMGFRQSPLGPFEPSGGNPNIADSAKVVQPDDDQRPVRRDDTDVGPYAGNFGLGRFKAMDRDVRPFRKLLSAQALVRREVFE